MGRQLPDQVKDKFTLRLPPGIAAWLHAAAKAAGLPRNDHVLNILARAMQAEQQRQAEPAPKRPSRRAQFLQAVRDCFGTETALERSGARRSELERWQADPRFAAELAAAQDRYLETLEANLVDIGRGERKGVSGALQAVLAAHHQAYGRVKSELLLKVLTAEHGALLAEIVRELGESAREGIQRALERYESGRDIRLASFTE